jgi:hypothetical protein
MRLAFSMPVHERTDAVLDSLRNILHFNPGSIVVLHAAKQSRDLDALSAHISDQILLNPQRYQTYSADSGLFHLHVSNYRHLCSQRADFDAFCIMSSNELFVRPGLANHLRQVRNLFQAIPYNLAEDWHLFNRCEGHPKVAALAQACGGSTIHGGQTEGQCYQRRLFSRICDIYETVFGDADNLGIQTEEFVPQTIAISEGFSSHPPFTLVDYSHLAFRANRRAIRLLSDPSRLGSVKLNLGIKRPLLLRSPHADATNEQVFALKRISRDPSHPLRRAIRELEAGADSEKPTEKPAPSRSPVSLVPFWSYGRILSGFIEFCARFGLKIRLTTGVRTLLRRWFKRKH